MRLLFEIDKKDYEANETFTLKYVEPDAAIRKTAMWCKARIIR